MAAVHQTKPLHELLSRDQVDIYVGPENTHWILHEKLLCHHSPFFRKIFWSKTPSNNKQKSYGLPDEEDPPFRLFVGWLYSDAIRKPEEERDLGNLFDLYLMAEKFQIQGLIQDVLDCVRTWYKDNDTYPGLRRVQYVYANTEDGSPMREMLVTSVARMLVLADGIPKHWDKALRKNGQLAVDILLAVQKWRLDADKVPDVRQRPVEDQVEGESENEGVKEEALEATTGVEQGVKDLKIKKEEEKEKLQSEFPNGLPNGVSHSDEK